MNINETLGTACGCCSVFCLVHLLLIETREKCPKRPEFLLSGLLFRKAIISCRVFEHGH